MRYRLMATYRGVPYEAGIGPTDSDVVLFAACPPPEELGFEPATGHWRKQLAIQDVQALWESRPMGTFRGARCIVLDDMGDRLHIAYLGHDAYQAEQLGYWQVDRGVFELVTPRDEVKDIVEDRVDYPQRSAGAGAGGAASAGTMPGAAGGGTGAGLGTTGDSPGATGDGMNARAGAAAMAAGASAAGALTGARPGTGANGAPEARLSPGTDATTENRFPPGTDTAGEARFSTGAGPPDGSRPSADAGADAATGTRSPAEAATTRFSTGGGAPGGGRSSARTSVPGGTRSAANPGPRPTSRAAPGSARSGAGPNASAGGASPAAMPGPADFAARSFDGRGDDTATRDLAVIPPTREAPLPLEAAARRAASARSPKDQPRGPQAQPASLDPAQMSGPHPAQPLSQSQRANMRPAQPANLTAPPSLPQTPLPNHQDLAPGAYPAPPPSQPGQRPTPQANHQGQPSGGYPAPPPGQPGQLPDLPQAQPANHQGQPSGPHPAQLPNLHQAQAANSQPAQPTELHQTQPPASCQICLRARRTCRRPSRPIIRARPRAGIPPRHPASRASCRTCTTPSRPTCTNLSCQTWPRLSCQTCRRRRRPARSPPRPPARILSSRRRGAGVRRSGGWPRSGSSRSWPGWRRSRPAPTRWAKRSTGPCA